MELLPFFNAILVALGGGASAVLAIVLALGYWFERKDRMAMVERLHETTNAHRDREKEHTADLVRTIEVVNAAVAALEGKR